MFLRRIALLLGLLAAATACGGAASGDGIDPPETAPVGGLPAQDSTPPSTAPQSTVVRTTVPIPKNEQLGAKVLGNRVILIGDSVLAGTSQRYGGEMCAALVPLGWQTEVNAETGRFIGFGDDVLDDRLAAGWDVGVIMLGNNYSDDQDAYREGLEDMVVRLSPMPVVLATVSEFKPSRAQVNAVIFEMAAKYPNVVILDWAAVTAANPSLTGADGLHLNDAGRLALASQVALVLGEAPLQPGKCLASEFKDDSEGSVNATTTTVRRSSRTTTTVAGSGSTTPDSTGSDPSVPSSSDPVDTTDSNPPSSPATDPPAATSTP